MKPGIDLLSRRGLLASAGAAVAFRNIPAASAQTSPKETNLRKSAFVLIGDGGSLRAPDLARRRLFETSGEPIALPERIYRQGHRLISARVGPRP